MNNFPAMSQGGETHSKRDCARFDSVAGSQLVPVVPTVAMVRAGLIAEDKVWPTTEYTEGCVQAVWKAMLRAARKGT